MHCPRLKSQNAGCAPRSGAQEIKGGGLPSAEDGASLVDRAEPGAWRLWALRGGRGWGNRTYLPTPNLCSSSCKVPSVRVKASTRGHLDPPKHTGPILHSPAPWTLNPASLGQGWPDRRISPTAPRKTSSKVQGHQSAEARPRTGHCWAESGCRGSIYPVPDPSRHWDPRTHGTRLLPSKNQDQEQQGCRWEKALRG